MLGSVCSNCGNDLVNVSTQKVPVGCAIIEGERDGQARVKV